MASTANRIIKNTGFLYAKMGITMFISLYTTRLILNSLGASDFGIFNIVGGAIAMLGFLNAAMASVTQRFMSYSEGEGDKEKQKSIFNISIILHFGISMVVGLALLVAGYFFFNGILNIPSDRISAAKVVYGSLIVSTMFTVMTVPYDAVMNAHENMKYYAIVGIIESLLKLAVAFACVYTLYDKLIVYGVLMACVPLMTLTIMRAYCHRNYEECIISPKYYWKNSVAKEMSNFAGWNLTSSMIIMISVHGQAIVLNNFFGTVLNAAMGITSQLNGQLQVLSSNMLKAFNPVLAKSAGAHNKDLLLKSTYYGSKFSSALYLLVAIPVFYEAPYILKLWLKEVPEWTIVFMRLQLVRSTLEFFYYTLSGAIMASGKIKNYTMWLILCNIVTLPCIYLVFKSGGAPYWLYVIAMFFGNICVIMAALYNLHQIYKMSVIGYHRNVVFPLVITLFISMTIIGIYRMFIEVDSIIELLLFIVSTSIVYLLTFYFVGCRREERNMIKMLLIPMCRKFL